jgi:hypothetical protein
MPVNVGDYVDIDVDLGVFLLFLPTEKLIKILATSARGSGGKYIYCMYLREVHNSVILHYAFRPRGRFML